jgi:hypothetical protein
VALVWPSVPECPLTSLAIAPVNRTSAAEE